MKHPLLQTFARFLGILDAAPPLVVSSDHSNSSASMPKVTEEKVLIVGGSQATDGESDNGEEADDNCTVSQTTDAKIGDKNGGTYTATSTTTSGSSTTVNGSSKKKPKKHSNNNDNEPKTHTVTNCKLNLDMFSIY